MKKKLGFEFRITIIYLIFGVFWIIFTDILLEMHTKNAEYLVNLQSVKGIIYVVFSALIVFTLSKRYARQQKFIKTNLQHSIEKAEESDRLKSVFLANMSHEIRTPMNGILGFVNLLENSEISSENYKQYVGLVRKSSERLLDTINDIIEISKIQAKEATLNVTAFDLNESVRFLFDFFKPAANEKKLSLSLKNTVADKKIRLQTDKIKLESILSNLIKNAIKFTHEGSIEFGVQQDNNAIRFYVKDTGIGIPVERQNAIFERFTQADLTITKPYEGSGLGLSISKAYADLLGGEIFVESKEGKGSTFSFTLPHELV